MKLNCLNFPYQLQLIWRLVWARLTKYLIISLILSKLITSTVYASPFAIKLENQDLPTQTKKLVEEFLNKGAQTLPQSVKSILNTQIVVQFERLAGLNNINDFEILCRQDRNKNEIKSFELGLTQAPGLFGISKDIPVIKISSVFLSEIVKGPAKSRSYGCGHGNFYYLALATLIHEIGHLVDFRLNLSEKWGFQAISKWHSSSENSNVNHLLSPDSYEYHSPRETFAVNLEYFLLDPNYKCRRPLHYSF
jgi:hypothetical protein